MSKNPEVPNRRWGRVRQRLALGLTLATLLFAGACGLMMRMMHGAVERPGPEEFGWGPRPSAGGIYRATLEPSEPVRIGRMQSMRLQVQDTAGVAINGATISVDGGMPQHGHGLPTRPRVTRNPGGGTYEVEGMKFNMDGWWVVKFRIDSGTTRDSVVFNLDL